MIAVYSSEFYVCCSLEKPRKTNMDDYAPICTLQALNSSATISFSKDLYKYDYPYSQVLRSYLRRVFSVWPRHIPSGDARNFKQTKTLQEYKVWAV